MTVSNNKKLQDPYDSQITFCIYNKKSIFWNAIFWDKILHKKNFRIVIIYDLIKKNCFQN